MLRRVLPLAVLATASLVARTPSAAPPQAPDSSIDRAFAKFFRASDPQGAAHLVDDLRDTGVSFDDAWRRLRKGREYSRDVKTGTVTWTFHPSDATVHQTLVRVPADYNPSTPLQVRVQLHGGVNFRRNIADFRDRPNATEGAHEIYVIPIGQPESAWWHDNQVENILAMVDRVKRTYNVDENHIHVTGFSDGATGVFFMAMRETTPWSSFLPLNGHIHVLANPSTGVQGELYLSNLINKPLFIVNGGRDPLYPTSSVDPYVRLLERLGGSLTYRPQAQAGHDLDWWPEERDRFEAFVRDHPRDPIPDRLSWTTDRTDRYNRAHWLVITKLGRAAGDSTFPDDNTVESERRDFGIRLDEKAATRVGQVVAGSPADELGLRKGDVILDIDGDAIATTEDVVQALGGHDLEAPLKMIVERAGHREAMEKVLPTPVVRVFHRGKQAGRIDLMRTGNTVSIRSSGVRAFTLLVSPDRFDFDRPVRVVVNETVVFDRLVKRDVGTLLRWAARDNDRTMLFGAEIPIELPEAP